MNPLPRLSLSDRAEEWIRQAIAAGKWTVELPGERILCQQLNISRPILRQALQNLEKTGIISCQPNRTRRIVPAKSLPRSSRLKKSLKKVIFLVGADDVLTPSSDHRVLNAIREHLLRAGWETERRGHPSLETAAAEGLLAGWIHREPRSTRWVLLSVPELVQSWFASHGLPTICMGSAYPNVKLPFFDVDHRAVARHAVGQFLRAAHRRIALVTLDRPRAGDLASEIGFREACESSGNPDIEPAVIRTPRDPDTLCRLLLRALRSQCPPTAFLISHAQLALTTLTFLQSRGLRIPMDASLICRDYEPLLAFVRPALAHYRSQETTEISQLLRLIQSDPLPSKPHWVFPRFIPADSLAGPKK